jgi:hypothetical protein
VKPGGGRILECLTRSLDDLASSCRVQMERVEDAAQKISAVRSSCRADVERLCPDVAPEAGPLVECLQANRESLSETCRSLGPGAAMASAEIVDALESFKSGPGVRQAMQVLQGIESTIAFSRSQILFQVDSYEGLNGAANADRLLFNPQIVFGNRREFAFQLKVPVLAVYPYAADRPAVTGLGAVTTALAWGFSETSHVHQYASFGLQWISPVQPPIGAAWAVMPAYSVTVDLARTLSMTGQIAWIRSFASSGYPDLDLLIFEPVVVLGLPGRAFLSLDTRLAWNFAGSQFLPVIKGVVGLYIDRKKSVTISAWYQTLLANADSGAGDPGSLSFKFGVGTALGYFFDF